ncbi:hypothetical protein Pcinc_010609 [Petrolisthes cinctipes]|uniref:Uncharacterized protein n=1 Tax=Petrolisthes cinctipes TaxID=88211 RepID=A0AAE1KV81_PETCI|nr:hypothetical protein Pcinc_010609 [Petrolisthes cinctipes]
MSAMPTTRSVKKCSSSILMGVNGELVQNLNAISPLKSLDEVVQECYTSEVTCNTASAISAPASGRAMSRYKRDKTNVKLLDTSYNYMDNKSAQ